MINFKYHTNRLRVAVETNLVSSPERSLALTKLDELELWLTRCTPTQEALSTSDEGRLRSGR